MSFALNLDKDLCIGCGICSESCAFGAITMSDFRDKRRQLPSVRKLCAGMCRRSLKDKQGAA